MTALTGDLSDTVTARLRRDPMFRQTMFLEAINACLAGDMCTSKAILRDLVNATVGFEGLAAEMKKPSKSLNRILAPHGNPSAEDFFGVVRPLQKKTRLRLRLKAD